MLSCLSCLLLSMAMSSICYGLAIKRGISEHFDKLENSLENNQKSHNPNNNHMEAELWAVKITGSKEAVDRVATDYGFDNLGQVQLAILSFLAINY